MSPPIRVTPAHALFPHILVAIGSVMIVRQIN